MDLAQLRQAVWAEGRRLSKRLPPKTVVHYALNKAGDEICRDTTAVRETRTFNAVASQATYPVIGKILEAYRARHNGIPLGRTSPEDLEAEYGANYETKTGTPTHWYMDALDVFRPWPIPSESLTNGFKLDVAVGWIADLVQDSDNPATMNKLPEKYHRALAYAAAYELFGDKELLARFAGVVAQIRADISQRYSQAAGHVPYRYL